MSRVGVRCTVKIEWMQRNSSFAYSARSARIQHITFSGTDAGNKTVLSHYFRCGSFTVWPCACTLQRRVSSTLWRLGQHCGSRRRVVYVAKTERALVDVLREILHKIDEIHVKTSGRQWRFGCGVWERSFHSYWRHFVDVRRWLNVFLSFQQQLQDEMWSLRGEFVLVSLLDFICVCLLRVEFRHQMVLRAWRCIENGSTSIWKTNVWRECHSSRKRNQASSARLICAFKSSHLLLHFVWRGKLVQRHSKITLDIAYAWKFHLRGLNVANLSRSRWKKHL